MFKNGFVLILAILMSFVAVAEDRYLNLSHFSEILGKEKRFAVVLPPDYTTQKAYPVLYMLHGAGGDYLAWHKPDGKLYELSRNYQMIIVTPDVETSWLVDSPIKPESQYESYMMKEFIPYIEANFSTIDSYRARGIMGLSMGGHGAMMLTLKYPDVFGVASSTSGVLDIRMLPQTAGKKDVLGEPSENPELWNNSSANYLAQDLQKMRRKPRLMFDVGLGDYVYGTNMAFHNTLKRQGIDHTFRLYPGTHAWGYWVARLPEHLAFHGENLRSPQIVEEE